MIKINITFLETRVVQDQHVGTALETRYEAGRTYGFDDARSAARWVRRGAAAFDTKVDAELAQAVVGEIVADRALSPPGAPEGGEDEAALAARIGFAATAVHLGVSVEAFDRLAAGERLAALEDLVSRIGDHDAGPATDLAPNLAAVQPDSAVAVADGREPRPASDFERLTDDELRAYIADRDGRAPHHNAGRARLLDIAAGKTAGT